jgi:hypothetical protein
MNVETIAKLELELNKVLERTRFNSWVEVEHHFINEDFWANPKHEARRQLFQALYPSFQSFLLDNYSQDEIENQIKILTGIV